MCYVYSDDDRESKEVASVWYIALIFVGIILTGLLLTHMDNKAKQQASAVQPLPMVQFKSIAGKVEKVEQSINEMSKDKKDMLIITTFYLLKNNETIQIAFKNVPMDLCFLTGKDVNIIYHTDDDNGCHIKDVVIHIDPSLEPEKK